MAYQSDALDAAWSDNASAGSNQDTTNPNTAAARNWKQQEMSWLSQAQAKLVAGQPFDSYDRQHLAEAYQIVGGKIQPKPDAPWWHNPVLVGMLGLLGVSGAAALIGAFSGAAVTATSGVGLGETGAVTGLAGSGFGAADAATVAGVDAATGAASSVLPSTVTAPFASTLPAGGASGVLDAAAGASSGFPWGSVLKYGLPAVGGAIQGAQNHADNAAALAERKREFDTTTTLDESKLDPWRATMAQTRDVARLDRAQAPPPTYGPPASSPYAGAMSGVRASQPSPLYLTAARSAQNRIATGANQAPSALNPNAANPVSDLTQPYPLSGATPAAATPQVAPTTGATAPTSFFARLRRRLRPQMAV